MEADDQDGPGIVRRRIRHARAEQRNALRRERRAATRGFKRNPFSAETQTIRTMTPLQINRSLNHLRMHTMLVFTEAGTISIGFTGDSGTLTVPLSRKLAARLACQLIAQLTVPTARTPA